MIGAQDIEACAAAFLARRDSDSWTATDERALATWIDERIEHRVSYLRLRAGWDRMGRLAALQSPAGPAASDTEAGHRWPVRVAAAIAATLLLVIGGSLGYRLSADRPDSFATTIGGRQTIPLADGTKVELNTDSKLVAALDKTTRHVWLERGEAYFEVAHDARHPFVVNAGSKQITVLGTKFVVRRDGKMVSVRVLEGRVRIENNQAAAKPGDRPVLALAGDEVLGVDGRRTTLVKRGDLREVEDGLTWREGLLTFDGTTLGNAAEEFNRYNRRRLIVSGPAATVEIEGTFNAADVEGFARILHDAYGFSVTETNNQINIS